MAEEDALINYLHSNLFKIKSINIANAAEIQDIHF